MDRARARWQWDRDPGRGRLASRRVDEATTGDDGGVAFSDRRPYARPGRLRSCGRPPRRDGYVANARAVPVVVNDQGVFADAGVADDGVRVDLGVGIPGASAWCSSRRTTTSDATLHERDRAALQTSADGSGGVPPLGGRPARDHASASTRATGNLQYVPERDGIPADVGSGLRDGPRLTGDAVAWNTTRPAAPSRIWADRT